MTRNIRSFLNDIVSSHNYYEFTILNDKNQNVNVDDNIQVYDTNLSAATFHDKLNKLSKKGIVKQYKESIVGDIHYLNFDNQEVNVIQKTFEDCQAYCDSFVALSGSRKKLNIVSYPSTFTNDYEAYFKVYQIKINNRIQIKFIQSKNVEDSKNTINYNITVYYTHDDNVEKKHNIDELVKVLSIVM